MSVLENKWVIKNADFKKTTFEKILENRNHLGLKENNSLHDPFLFKDMKDSVARIEKAISSKEKILIFGDYDVDGITGTAILVHILRLLKADVVFRLPNRVEDGYGLSEKFIEKFAEQNISLVITVDCGISCHDVIKKLKDIGIETIITDHHTIPEKYPTDAHTILHPKYKSGYPFKDLTGAGVALKLAHALIKNNFPKEERATHLIPLIDLAALGTVADLGPLKDENWIIVRKGLENLANTKWVGLKKIIELSGVKDRKFDSSIIGYYIAPRINAAGRISDPHLALNLLLQESMSKEVDSMGGKLEELNEKRKEMTFEAIEQAKELFSDSSPAILIAEDKSWHVGILGLIAGKLAERYNKPAIMMQDLGDILVASARSPEYFNIIEALTANSKYLISYGGHAQAAGFNIKKSQLANFKKAIAKYTKVKIANKMTKKILEIDCEIMGKEINLDFFNKLEKLKPFGIENSQPTFLLKNLEPFFINEVGKEQAHLKFSVKLDKTIDVIAFNMERFASNIRKQKKIDLVCNLDLNTWNHKKRLQLRALDFRGSKM